MQPSDKTLLNHVMCSLKGLSLLYFSDKDKCIDLQLQTKKKNIFSLLFFKVIPRVNSLTCTASGTASDHFQGCVIT